MNKIKLASLQTGGVKLLLVQIISLFIFSHILFGQNLKIKFNIKETSAEIIVMTKFYTLSINKSNAICHLKNSEGIYYTSFPLDIQFSLNENRSLSSLSYHWKTRDKNITMTVIDHDVLVRETKIVCTDEAFEIQLRGWHPGKGTGVYLLLGHQDGLDTSTWENLFSPEPDDYFQKNPAIDARVDRDQQWTFSFAPLNLSFQTPAGWFSIGLAELPDASIYTFKNNALWLDYPWEKVSQKATKLYPFPPLVFTFNNSPWDAVGDFSNYIYLKNKAISPSLNIEQRVDWWTRPLVSTRGEQRVQNIAIANPQYSSQWVKDYVAQQIQALDSLKFTLIIESMWSRADGDPHPSDRFQNLRSVIDWCHNQGLKVILHWKAWKVEANSMAIDMAIVDGEYVDATHPHFENYVDSCCHVLLGNGENELDADGLKIDCLYLVRDPATANFANSSLGIGFREIKRYLETFYRTAKKYKSDALIMASAIDPHFINIEDMVKINDDWDNKLVREKRARIITQSLPGMLINGDASDMSIKIANYHYVTSAIYGIPCVQYLTRLHDSEITSEFQNTLKQLLRLYEQKPVGRVRFVDYGNWQIVDKNNEIVAESIPGGKGLLIYHNKSEASFLCTENSKVHLVFERHLLKAVHNENGTSIPFTDLGHGIYELENFEQGKIYQLQLRKISMKRR